MPAKITYKTSEEHTRKLMFEFFKKTSIPRILRGETQKQQKSS